MFKCQAQDNTKAKRQARNRFGIGKSPITLNENYSPHKNGNNNQTYNRFIKRLLKDNQMEQDIELRLIERAMQYLFMIVDMYVM